MTTVPSTTRFTRWTTLLTTTLCAAFFATIGFADARAADGPIVATLSADQPVFAAAEGIVVHLTLANPTDGPVAVLRWLTPAGGVDGPIFTIERDGVPVPYVGRRVKRAAPTASDYLEVPAGDVVAWDVDLSDAYDFSASGTYVITYDVAAADLYADADAPARLTSTTIAVDVDGRPNRTLQQLAANARTATGTYLSCSGSQQTDTGTARTNATTYASWASAYLQANLVDAHYTQWFGTYSAGRYATVKNHFTNIVSLLGANPMRFDCSGAACDPSTYAYVFPTDTTHTVYLCGAFWSAPATGTDSRAGTLIHESSHFSDVAGTQDYAYGQSAAQSLASSNPAQAIMNADNHEYFGETSTAPAPTATPTATATPAATATATAAGTATTTPLATATPTPDPGATATPAGHGFVPPDAASAKCEKAVAKYLGKLADCTATCQMKQADAAVKGKPFDEDACEEGTKSCRASYDLASGKLLAKSPSLCPACLDAVAHASLADLTLAFVDDHNGAAYCAGTTAFGGDDTGFVPPDADTASCETRVAKGLKKLAACITKCRAKQVDAMLKGKPFDVDACTRTAAKSCRAAFDAASAKLLAVVPPICPPCLDATGQSDAADAVTGFVEARGGGTYCAGSVPLP